MTQKPEGLLQPDERIIFRARDNWFISILRASLIAFALLLLIWIFN